MKRRGRVKVAVAAGLALGGLGLLGLQLRAEARSERADALRKACETDEAYHRRAAALRDLVEMDTADAREALAALAGSKDERLAVQALSALAREDSTASVQAIESVLADDDRSRLVRGAALASLAAIDKRAERTSSSAVTAAKSDADPFVREMGDALERGQFGATGGGR
jgi:HEAT repeat protein